MINLFFSSVLTGGLSLMARDVMYGDATRPQFSDASFLLMKRSAWWNTSGWHVTSSTVALLYVQWSFLTNEKAVGKSMIYQVPGTSLDV